jgi:hypothetical protein
MTNCRVDGCTLSGGVLCTQASAILIAYKCSFDGNSSGVGATTLTSARGSFVLHSCSIHHNSSHGVFSPASGNLVNCLIYRNGGDGIRQGAASSIPALYNCTIALNTANGIYFSNASTVGTVAGMNNIFYENGAYGFRHGSANRNEKNLWGGNVYYGNTTDSVDVNSGDISVTDFDSLDNTDPSFVSTTDNSENFTPASPSVIGAGQPGVMPYGGTGYMTPGALQPSAGGSGGFRGFRWGIS